jgi:hypothetical protein
MDTPPSTESKGSSLGMKALAVLVLIVAAWVLLHFLIHIASAIAGFVVIIVAIVAVVWALRVVL